MDAFAIYAITLCGGRHVVLPRFEAADTLRAIEREGVSCCNMASTMVLMALNNPAAEAVDLSSLRILSCGGSPLPPAAVARAIALFGCEFFVRRADHLVRLRNRSHPSAREGALLSTKPSMLMPLSDLFSQRSTQLRDDGELRQDFDVDAHRGGPEAARGGAAEAGASSSFCPSLTICATDASSCLRGCC